MLKIAKPDNTRFFITDWLFSQELVEIKKKQHKGEGMLELQRCMLLDRAVECATLIDYWKWIIDFFDYDLHKILNGLYLVVNF